MQPYIREINQQINETTDTKETLYLKELLVEYGPALEKERPGESLTLPEVKQSATEWETGGMLMTDEF